MSAARFGTMQKATAIVPLAMLSAAWTASLAGVGATSAVADDGGSLPDGTTVPTQAIEAPASVSRPGVLAAGVPAGQAGAAIENASTQGIPAAALSAYQRAESVINAADKSCSISWQLIAAIGRVESDHGRYAGNVLDARGVARPGIYGIALDGTNKTSRITDTDAGQYDNDTKFDRAVGPMQFIPSTWSVVGVDGDSDGKRNPQDIDDAALATAVYLCSGDDDLSSEAGQRRSVYRYNHSNDYVDLVLSIMQAYLDGDFTSVPTSTTSAGIIMPDPDFTPAPAQQAQQGNQAGPGQPAGAAPTQQPTSGPTDQPTQQPSEPVETPDDEDEVLPSPSPTQTQLPTTGVSPLDQTLTKAEATAKCIAQGVVDNPLTSANELTQCVDDLLNP